MAYKIRVTSIYGTIEKDVSADHAQTVNFDYQTDPLAQAGFGKSINLIKPGTQDEAQFHVWLDEDQDVTITIFNREGVVKELIDGSYPAGPHIFTWDGTNSEGSKVASGIYNVLIVTGDEKERLKVAVIR